MPKARAIPLQLLQGARVPKKEAAPAAKEEASLAEEEVAREANSKDPVATGSFKLLRELGGRGLGSFMGLRIH